MSTYFNSYRNKIASLRKRAIKRTAAGIPGMSSFGFGSSTSSTNSFNTYGSSGRGASQSRYNPVFDDLSEGTIIEQFMPTDPRRLHRIWRRIYLEDPVAGPAIELYKELPWSDFQLTGIDDRHIEQLYTDALNAINIVSLLPELSAEFLVMGKIIGHLHMDDAKGYPTRLIIHDPDWIRVSPTPIPGFPPKLDIIPTPDMKAWANSTDERDLESQTQVDWLVQLIKQGKEIPLPNENSFYIPRKTSPYDSIGASVYTRIIMFVAYEKALVNATIATAKRRMSRIRHITAGIDGEWTPSKEELDDIADYFMRADEDPVGAIVVTRTGINANEVGGGTPQDILRISEESPFLSSGKLNSLGVNEAFISGEASYNALEQIMSVFLEKVRAHREFFVHNLILDKLLLPLATKHKFIKKKQAHLDHRIRIASNTNEDYILPTLSWTKSLRPIADRDYLEILGMMEEKGIPVTISTWAASAGFDLDGEIGQFEDDIRERKALAEQRKKIQAVAPEAAGQIGPPGGGGGFGGSEFGGFGEGEFGGGEFGGEGLEGIGEGTPAGGEDGGAIELPTAASYKGANTNRLDDIDSVNSIINLPHWNKKGKFMGLDRDNVELTCRRLLSVLGNSSAKAISRHVVDEILKTGNSKRDQVQRYLLGRAGILHGVILSHEVANDITDVLCNRILTKQNLAKELRYVYAYSLTKNNDLPNKNMDNVINLQNKKFSLKRNKVNIPGDTTNKSLLTGFVDKKYG